MALIKIPKEMGSTPGIVDNSNATAITIDSSENVGIGATTPAAAYGTDTVLEIKGDTSPGLVINDTGQGSKYGIHADSDDLKITYGANVLATFQNGGNVGIGTTSPNSYSGYVALTLNHATNGGLLDFELNGTLQGEIYSNSANVGLGLQAVGNRSIKFLTNGTERVDIDGAGLITLTKGSAGTGLKIETSSGQHTIQGSDASGTYIEQTGTTAATRRFRLQNQDGSNNYTQVIIDGANQRVEIIPALDVHKGAVWSETGQGTGKGTIHLDPASSTDHAGSSITFGASDAGGGQTAQAGIYTRTDGTYGTKMYIATTDSYAAGSKTAMYIDHSGNVNVPRGYMSAKQPAAIVRGNGTFLSPSSTNAWNEFDSIVGFTVYAQSSDSPFSESTGRFTAPIAGYYLCTASGYIQNTGGQTLASQYIHPQWSRNGSVGIMGQTPYQIYGHNEDTASGTIYTEGMGRSDVVKCDAGDYLTMQIYVQGNNWKFYGNYCMLTFTFLAAV